jgi:hypothetical protein
LARGRTDVIADLLCFSTKIGVSNQLIEGMSQRGDPIGRHAGRSEERPADRRSCAEKFDDLFYGARKLRDDLNQEHYDRRQRSPKSSAWE